MKGKVKWFNPRKGFGFIVGHDGREIFVHNTALPDGQGYLHEGDSVEYDIEETERGPNAINLKMV